MLKAFHPFHLFKLTVCILFVCGANSSVAFPSYFLDSDSTPTPFSFPLRDAEDSSFVQMHPSLLSLSDTLWKALIRNKKEYILGNTPTFTDYLLFVDSATKAKYPDKFFQIKFRKFNFGLQKQWKQLQKDAKYLDINFKRSQIRHAFFEDGIEPLLEKPFCYINLEFQRGMTDFVRVRILLYQMENSWYFADELSVQVLKVEKIKKPRIE
jgi:hypothetical protein